MRIIVIIGLYPPHHLGGYEIRCKQVVDHLIARGHEVEILTSACEDKECKLHVDEKKVHRKLHNIHAVISKFQKAKTIITDLRFIDGRIKRFKPDIIYLWHITRFTKDLMPYLAGIDTPVVSDEGGRGLAYMWNNHGAWHRFLDRKRESGLMQVMKKFFTFSMIKISRNLLKDKWQWPNQMVGYFNSKMGLQYARDAGVPTGEFVVIHSGIELDYFPFERGRDEVHTINLLMPGRIESIKGQMDGVELLLTLIKRNIHTHLTIVGPIFSDEYYDEILKYIEENQLKGNVTNLPMVSYEAMSDLYRRADFCFFPSQQGMGFSRIPIEAMASGCLVITYGNEGSDEVITNNETGFVVAPGDYERMYSIIQEVIGNPMKAQKIREAARENVERNHSMEIYVNNIESLLLSASKRNPDKYKG